MFSWWIWILGIKNTVQTFRLVQLIRSWYNPFLKDNFPDDPVMDSYGCPNGLRLAFKCKYQQSHQRSGYKSVIRSIHALIARGVVFTLSAANPIKRKTAPSRSMKSWKITGNRQERTWDRKIDGLKKTTRHWNRKLLWWHQEQHKLQALPCAWSFKGGNRNHPGGHGS